jgi:predicted DNA-binding transcriptional regulator YafY
MLRDQKYPNTRTAARELEVHPRTIHRDLVFLRDSWGAPLEFSARRNGYFYTDANFALPLMSLSEGELIALFLAERVMQQFKNTPYAKALSTAFRKLTASLPDSITVDLSHWEEAYSFRQVDGEAMDPHTFHELGRAIQHGEQLELLYWTASTNQTCSRIVDPYHMTGIDGQWYLVAYCHLREEIRMFAPSRVRSVSKTGHYFERPPEFRIDEYLDHSFRAMRGRGEPQRVRLRFSAEAARYVRERTWHSSQQIEEREGGALELTFNLGHLLEVKRWVLSWGADCQVLEPDELKQLVRDELQLALSGTVELK